MIYLERGIHIAACDGCGKTVNTGQVSMQQAANYLSREENWDSWKRGARWKNYCPRCVEPGTADPELDRAGIDFTRKAIKDDD